jgi:hypothetical protein
MSKTRAHLNPTPIFHVLALELPLGAVCIALSLSSIACTDTPVTLGQQHAPLDREHAQAAARAPAIEGAGGTNCDARPSYEPEVDWEGYVENGRLAIAADRVRVRLPRDGEPGFVLLGSGPRLATPTDAAGGIPCLAQLDAYVPGHPYTLLAPNVSDGRLRFRIWRQEPFEPWCALHEESAQYPGMPDGACEVGLTNNGGDRSNPSCATLDGDPVSCQVPALCGSCTCDSTGCRAAGEEHLDAVPDFRSLAYFAQFDLRVEGDDADGTVIGLAPESGLELNERVRLDRAD